MDTETGGQQEAILLGSHGADVLELQRVADDHGTPRAEQQRQRGGDVALAGFVDHHQVEEAGVEGQASARRKRGHRPAR